MKKTYLLDFDGTLVDSMPIFMEVLLRILDENGISYDDDIVNVITPMGCNAVAEYYVSLGVPLTVKEILDIMDMYAIDEYRYRIPAKEGVEKTLKALSEQGVSLNVLTASPHSMLDPCLKRLGLWELFDNVWSCNDFDTTKADPKIYHACAEKLGVNIGNIIFIDDNLGAVKTASSAGMITYGIYDESSAAYADDIKAVSKRYLNCFSELLDAIE